MTIRSREPSLPSVMLYSHTDVVPTFPEHWKYDSFAAVKEENGDIYARGAQVALCFRPEFQDMKNVGISYVEAIRRHFKAGTRQFLRIIHIVWGPRGGHWQGRHERLHQD